LGGIVASYSIVANVWGVVFFGLSADMNVGMANRESVPGFLFLVFRFMESVLESSEIVAIESLHETSMFNVLAESPSAT
jgi:hypothetical protein